MRWNWQIFDVHGWMVFCFFEMMDDGMRHFGFGNHWSFHHGCVVTGAGSGCTYRMHWCVWEVWCVLCCLAWWWYDQLCTEIKSEWDLYLNASVSERHDVLSCTIVRDTDRSFIHMHRYGYWWWCGVFFFCVYQGVRRHALCCLYAADVLLTFFKLYVPPGHLICTIFIFDCVCYLWFHSFVLGGGLHCNGVLVGHTSIMLRSFEWVIRLF